jgi:tricorn protease
MWLLVLSLPALAAEPIRLANNPSLSPDGKRLAFDWNGDVWVVPTAGGVARPLTLHPARDRQPKFSPDGKQIAFISDREGSPQVYVMPAEGGTPRQLTFHTAGYSLEGWYPDGKSLLVQVSRDHAWRHPERFFRISGSDRGTEQFLFDDYGHDASLSPDGTKLLFRREGPAWWRKGYHGSQAGQVWLYDLEKKSFTCLLRHEHGCLWPLWKPDGKGFYFVAGSASGFNLCEHDLDSGKDTQLTHFKDDSVVFPTLSADGSTLVFRHLFDLYQYRPGSKEPPVKIEIAHEGDRPVERRERRTLTQATHVAFSPDGLEIAFTAGGDLWVMDTELREPRAITRTAEEERQPVFSPDGDSLVFVADRNGQCDVWKAERNEKNKFWWQNRTFKVERLTTDGEVKSAVTFSPDGKRIAYIRGRGDLWVADADGKNPRRVLESWNVPEYDWSPDGKWMVYAVNDNDFNRDVWILPLEGAGKPYNLSRHPFNESRPVWSPDGRAIAFAGHRSSGPEANIGFVWLRAEDDEKDARDRAVEKAIEKINKVRNPKSGGPDRPDPKPGAKSPPEVTIDFERLHERVRRIPIDGSIGSLFWSPDSSKLAYTLTGEGKSGTYTIDVGDDLKPKQLTTTTGTQPRWLKQGNQITWLLAGIPASYPAGVPATVRAPSTTTTPPTSPRRGGSTASADPTASEGAGTSYRFSALQEIDVGARNAAAFDLCWRTMRDNWYDERLGNRDWSAVRAKYHDVAGQAPDVETLGTVVHLMLGELNGSHLGFSTGTGPRLGRRGPAAPEPTAEGASWREVTAHLGLRFDLDRPGPGLTVRDVLPGGPADHKKARLLPGEVVLKIDGIEVDARTDLTRVLNGVPNRDVTLLVRDADGKERDVTLRPISWAQTRPLLYNKWVKDNARHVEEASQGTLGYLHIAAMDMSSFHKFEEQLWSIGAGKDGLVIDVRENGGGSTTDHLLTALTQPVHAITVPRGGGPGYPQDRKVYATWNRPIVVLCNQNSFSNAEIFSHAIKTLKRGQLVGVPTAGGVISTGAVGIMDVGTLRLPTRGWFLLDSGEDMELNGAVPQHIVWPQPGDMPRGKDVQLDKAIEVLRGDVKAWLERPRPPLRRATERP